jgi:hypothetical protein
VFIRAPGVGLREPSVIRPNQCLLFFDFGFAGRGAALTRRRLVAFACGSVASTFLFCSKSDQNFAVSCRNCSARNMTRSCKKRLPYWESLLIRTGCLYRIAHSDCLPPLPNAAAGSAACVFISQEGPSVPASDLFLSRRLSDHPRVSAPPKSPFVLERLGQLDGASRRLRWSA